MAYASLEHTIRNIFLKEEKEQNVNPAKKKGPAGGDWEEASEEDRKGKAKQIVQSVKTPGQKEVKEQLRLNPDQKSKVLKPSHKFSGNEFISPPIHIKPPQDNRNDKNDHAQRSTNKSVQIKNKIGKETNNIAEKEVKEISDLGGQTSSVSNPEPEDGGKKKVKEAFGDASGVEFGVEKESGKKKVKESAFNTVGGDTPMGSMGGRSNPGPSSRMNTEDGGKKKIKDGRAEKIKKEAEGTKDRKTIENVARANSAPSPFDRKSKLAKNAEIKTKIIDEGKKRANTIKKVVKGDKNKESEESGNGPTKVIGDVIWNPNLQKPDKDTVSN